MGSLTTNYNLYKPDEGETGWATLVNASFDTIDTVMQQNEDADTAQDILIALNTAHRGSDGKDHSDVVLNNTHRASDGKDHSDVVLNNTHRASDGKDHSDVVLNNTHRASDGKDHSDVVLNNTHRASDGKDHSDVVLNNSKLTNQTHTGDMDGSVALTANSAIITGKPAATVASADLVLISDDDDSGNLKQVTAQALANLGAGGAPLEVEDEAVSLSTAVTKINFAGAGVTATEPIADEILVTVPGGAGTDELVGIDAVATPGYIGAAAGDGVLRTEATIDYADGGDFVTLGLADTAVTPAAYTSADITVDQQGRITAAANGSGGGATLELEVTQAHAFAVGNWIYHNGTTYELADALDATPSNSAVTAESIGVVTAIVGGTDFTVQFGGRVTGLSGLTAGQAHFLSETAGAITATAPSTENAIIKPVLVADSATTGFIFNMRGVGVTSTTSFFQPFGSGSLSAGVLTVTHNLGHKYATIQVYNDSDQMIVPDQITLVDQDTATIDLSSFTVSASGWNVVVIDIGTTTATTNISATDTITVAGVKQVTHNLNSSNVIVQVYDDSGDLVQPDDITVVSANRVDVDTTSFTVAGTWTVTVLTAGAAQTNVTLQNAFDNGQTIDHTGTVDGVTLTQSGVLAAGEFAQHIVSNTAQTNNTSRLLKVHDQNASSTHIMSEFQNAGVGSVLRAETGAVLAANRSVIDVNAETSAQTTGLAIVHIDNSNASSTIPGLKIASPSGGGANALEMDAPMVNTGQPAFSAVNSGGEQTNIPFDTNNTVICVALFDRGGNFASNTFTAPVTGVYQFNASVAMKSIDISATQYVMRFTVAGASARSYNTYMSPNKFTADITDNWSMTNSVLAEMTSGDTCILVINPQSAASITDIINGGAFFSGFLVA